MKLEDRAKQLASQRAENTSGVDIAAMLQALSGAVPQQTPSVYAYGMRPDEVRMEAESAQKLQQQQMQQAMQAAQMAIAQDSSLYDRMQNAQSMAMREKEFDLDNYYKRASLGLQQQGLDLSREKLELEKEASRIENGYKEALAAGQKALASKYQYEANMLALQADALKGMSGMTIPMANPEAVKAITDNTGKPVLDTNGQPTYQPSHIQIPLLGWKAMGGKLPTPDNSTAGRKYNDNINFWKSKGVSDNDAAFLAQQNLGNIYNNISKIVNARSKQLTDTGESLGQVSMGHDNNGQEIFREMTPDEYVLSQTSQQIAKMFSMLDPNTLKILTNNPGLLLGGNSQEDNLQNLADIFLQQLQQMQQ